MESSPVPGIGLRFVEANGIRMRLAEAGHPRGDVVLFAHGWPESWYSWRHQLTTLADAGYRVLAPDMRGFGATDRPEPVEAYDIDHLTTDLVGLLDAVGGERAHLVGHDWGAIVAAHAALFHPERFPTATLMSVPFGPRPPRPPTEIFRGLFGDDFFYVLYHNEPGGVAEAEYDADPRGLLRRLFCSPDTPRRPPEITDPKRAAGGWIPRLGAPEEQPPWLTDADLDYVVAAYEQAGFRGGLNYYRNLDRNWETTAAWADRAIEVPTMFIAGAADAVIGGADEQALRERMHTTVADLREVELIPGIGHWVQQEAPAETNAALLRFLSSSGG